MKNRYNYKLCKYDKFGGLIRQIWCFKAVITLKIIRIEFYINLVMPAEIERKMQDEYYEIMKSTFRDKRTYQIADKTTSN